MMHRNGALVTALHCGCAESINARTFNLALFLFVSITLTNAALVDYRSANSSQTIPSAPVLKQGHERMPAVTYYYLQARKYAGFGSQTSEFAPPGSRWRGLTRSEWTRAGLCCGVFDILVKMKGGGTRVRLLAAISDSPRNKLQLAELIGIDWKAVDRHIERLLEFGLVNGYLTVGTSTIFCITDKGRRALTLACRGDGAAFAGCTDKE